MLRGRRSFLLAAGVFLLSLSAWSFLRIPVLRQWIGYDVQPSRWYETGETVDLDARSFGTYPLTVVIFSRSTCEACRKSKEIITELVREVGALSSAEVVLVVPRKFAEEIEYAETVGIDPTRVFTAPENRSGLVPTIAVVDKRGVVKFIASGVPQPSTVTAVRNLVLGASSDLAGR